MIQQSEDQDVVAAGSPETPAPPTPDNTVVDDLSVCISDGVIAKAKETIRRLMPDSGEIIVAEKAAKLIELAVTEWAQWIANDDRDSRIDDMIVGRLSNLYAEIIEVVPSQDEIARLFCLKPNQARQVSALFTQSPTPQFRRRVLVAMRDKISAAITDIEDSFSIEINKNLDEALKQEEEALHKNDTTYKHRQSGKALFGGSSIINVVFDDKESGEKLVAHLDGQISALDAEPTTEE
jgi:hypothetical protein